jgi:uncharacterized protein involved in exopolysaccharide biosynthesis
MPDIIELFKRRGRSLLIWLIVMWAITALILWLRPEEYKSETTSVASSVVASDPSRLFRNQVQHLYSPLGSPDQLDLLVGSGRLDTVYRPLVRRFDLLSHYSISGNSEKAFLKAVKKLKKNTEVFKSDYGELKVRVWDEDPQMAADLANALTDRLDSMHRELMSRQNIQTRSALERGLKRLDLSGDSLSSDEMSRYRSLYKSLIEEYTLMLEQRPPAIHILDAAAVPVAADRPQWVLILIAVTVITFFIWLIAQLWSLRQSAHASSTDK